MKRLQKVIYIFFASVTLMFAQNGQILNMQFQENKNNSKPQLISAQIQVDAASSDGIFIALPPGLNAVVRTATLDGNALWLINSEDVVDKDNILGWHFQNDGIVLHYNADFSGQLQIELAPDSARLNRFEQVDINVHQVNRVNEQLNVENTAVAQSNLKIKQNTPTDEE